MTSIRPFVLSIVTIMFVVAVFLVSTETSALTWKTEKFSVEGDFDFLKDNDTIVQIQRSDGIVVQVDLNKLSDSDQLYIEQNYSESDLEDDNTLNSSNQQSVTEKDNSGDNLIKAVNLLEKEGQYLVARKKLLLALQNDFSEKLLDLWIKLDNNLCPPSKNYKHSLSVFTPEKRTWAEYLLDDKVIVGGGVVIYIPNMAEKYKKERLDKDMAKDFGTLEKGAISKTLEIYETLKKSTDALLSYLENEMLQTKDCVLLKKLSDYSTKVKALKKAIKTQRTNYLSYCVVSPYLADSERWIYLANEQAEYTLWPQKESLDKAVKMLSFSCHGQYLYECSEDVRKQFFEVQKKLKSMVSTTVQEELKVLTTLQDSSDPSKKRGADAWWE
ncbi:MAG: hypothetical protein IJH67_04885 [Thermoguttaceae bacterium]|nr:hypothetical protein [Thermoguttaceae bacterium]